MGNQCYKVYSETYVFEKKIADKKLRFGGNRRYLIITIFAILGFVYQFITLSLMLSNDVLNQNNLKLGDGYFPWGSVFFTFTFGSNLIVFLSYFMYIFIFGSSGLKRNNVFLFMACVYISLVFVVVTFFLFPVAIALKSNVDFTSKTSALTYAALIMPHAPGPILFIVFSLLVFSLNRSGNQILKILGFGKLLGIIFLFFFAYMCMDILLNFIKTGAYYIQDNKKIYFEGYSVYSWFTAINPHLPLISGGKVTGYGKPIYIFWYLFAIVLFVLLDVLYYFIVTKNFLSYYKLVPQSLLPSVQTQKSFFRKIF